MPHSFREVLLIVAFNFAQNAHNKEFYRKIYGSFFKKIIFVSDGPTVSDPEINIVPVERGCYIHRIFPNLYRKYPDDFKNIRGLFYLMDDNILNINILTDMDPDKIIYPHGVLKPLDNYSGWQWDRYWGKPSIHNLLRSQTLSILPPAYQIKEFCGGFADYFYLPSRYLTPELFQLFDIFGNYNIFLELAIPTIICHIQPEAGQYNVYTQQVLWEDRHKTQDWNWVADRMAKDLFIHPIKLDFQMEAKEQLLKIFEAKLKAEASAKLQPKKCIVITTINPPSEQVQSYAKLSDWRLIVVGDSKTDDSLYAHLNCVYLGLTQQKALFPSLYDKIPLRSYTRKMFGYLYAMQNGYKIIYDTDDDNKYIGDLNIYSPNQNLKSSDQPGMVNLYRVFTDKHIWPRGIPPQSKAISEIPILSDTVPNLEVAVIQGLVNNDPDVDAHYRINVSSEPFNFEKNPGWDVVLNKYSVCPFNTQNTFWIDSSLFYAMYLPTTVTFRYTDILRGFIALYQLWRSNKTIRFTMPTAIQERNEHDLQKDYESEVSMYQTAERVIHLLNENKNATLMEVYRTLAQDGIVLESEFEILAEWLNFFN